MEGSGKRAWFAGARLFVPTAYEIASLVIHPGERLARHKLPRRGLGGLMVGCRLFRAEVSITFFDVH